MWRFDFELRLKDFMNLKLEPFGHEDLNEEYVPSADNKEVRYYSEEEIAGYFERREEIILYGKMIPKPEIPNGEMSMKDLEDINKTKEIKGILESFADCINIEEADKKLKVFEKINNKLTRKNLIEVTSQ